MHYILEVTCPTLIARWLGEQGALLIHVDGDIDWKATLAYNKI